MADQVSRNSVKSGECLGHSLPATRIRATSGAIGILWVLYSQESEAETNLPFQDGLNLESCLKMH